MHEFLAYRVGDAMTTGPIVIERHTPLAEVEGLFERHDFNGLPVVEQRDRLIGMLTKLDILKAFMLTKRSVIPAYAEIMRQPAGQFMTAEPITVDPDMPLTRVLEEMITTRCKSFPVLDRGRLVGIIAREDVLHALRKAVAGQPPAGSWT